MKHDYNLGCTSEGKRKKYFFVILIFCGFTIFSSCKSSSAVDNEATGNQEDNSNIENKIEFKITKGACGKITYTDSIGYDFISAYNELEKRKVEEFSKYCPDNPCYEIRLEFYKIEVVDKNNNVPDEEFFAIRVIDKKTNLSVHSVSEVISDAGNLYYLSWCPD